MKKPHFDPDEALCADGSTILAEMARRRRTANHYARELGCHAETVRRATRDPLSSTVSLYLMLDLGIDLHDVFKLRKHKTDDPKKPL